MSGLDELLVWLAFLVRPQVLLQLVLLALSALVIARLQRRSAVLRRCPWGLLQLGGVALLAGLLSLLGRRSGLVLLAGLILSVWLLLRLLEVQVLRRWLAPSVYRQLVSRLIRPAYFLGVSLVVLDALDSLQTLAALPLGVWFGSPVALGALFQVLVVLYLAVVGAALPAFLLSWMVERSLDLTEGGRRAVDLVVRYGVIALALIWATTRLGFNQTGLLAVAGGLSVGLGFGIKEVFSNFISGLWLLFEGSVRPGEVLIHDGEACEVRSLGLRAATLWRGSDNAELMVPNQTFFTSTTTTYTRTDRMRRCFFELEASNRFPPEQVIALLESMAAGHGQVLDQPEPQARLLEFGPDTNRFRLAFSIANPLAASAVTSGVKLSVWRCFAKLGIVHSADEGMDGIPAELVEPAGAESAGGEPAEGEPIVAAGPAAQEPAPAQGQVPVPGERSPG